MAQKRKMRPGPRLGPGRGRPPARTPEQRRYYYRAPTPTPTPTKQYILKGKVVSKAVYEADVAAELAKRKVEEIRKVEAAKPKVIPKKAPPTIKERIIERAKRIKPPRYYTKKYIPPYEKAMPYPKRPTPLTPIIERVPKLKRFYEKAEPFGYGVGRGAYEYVRRKPEEVAAFAALPGALRIAGAGVKGIAGITRISKIPGVTKVAPKVVKGIGTGIGALWFGEKGVRVYKEPKYIRKGEIFGETGVQLTALGMGAAAAEEGLIGIGGRLRTIGRKPVPIKRLVPPEVLARRKAFPEAPISKHLKLFLKPKYKLPSEVKPTEPIITKDFFGYKLGLGREKLKIRYKKLPKGVTGKIAPGQKVIYLNKELKKLPFEKQKQTIFHEFGHHLQFKYEIIPYYGKEYKALMMKGAEKGFKGWGIQPSEELIADSMKAYFGGKTMKEVPGLKKLITKRLISKKIVTKDLFGVWKTVPEPWAREPTTMVGGYELPGAYVAPAVSPYFLRIPPKVTKYRPLGLEFPGIPRPTILRIYPKGIKKIPKKVPKKDYYKFLLEKAKKGIAYVPKIKREVEAIIPPETPLVRVGRKYYTIVKGKRVPIEQYAISGISIREPAKVKPVKYKELVSYYKGRKPALVDPFSLALGKAVSYRPVAKPPSYIPPYKPYKPPVYKPYKPPVRRPTYRPPSIVPRYRPPIKPPSILPPYRPPKRPPYKAPPYKPPKYPPRYRPPYKPPKYPPYRPPTLPPIWKPRRAKGIFEPRKPRVFRAGYTPSFSALFFGIGKRVPEEKRERAARRIWTGLEMRPILLPIRKSRKKKVPKKKKGKKRR